MKRQYGVLRAALAMLLLAALLCGALAEGAEAVPVEPAADAPAQADPADAPAQADPADEADAVVAEPGVESLPETSLSAFGPADPAAQPGEAPQTEAAAPSEDLYAETAPDAGSAPNAETTPSIEPGPDAELTAAGVDDDQLQAPEDPGEEDETAADGAGEGEPAEPRTMTLNVEWLAMGEGEGYTLCPSAPPLDGEPVTYQFYSSSKKVAKVYSNGFIRAKRKGWATITVVSSAGDTATCTVRVMKAPAWIKLNAKRAWLGYDAEAGVGMEFALVPRLSKKSASASIYYYGYNPDVLTVSQDGVVTLHGVGTTTVTACTYNKKKAKITIAVLPAPRSFSVEAGNPVMCPGEARDAAAVLPANTVASVCFRSDNPEVAEVNAATGRIEARAEGEATIIAEAFNGVTAAFPIRVQPAPDSVQISETYRVLGVKETFRLTAVPAREDGVETTATVYYGTSNRKVAVVYPDGTVRAKKKGTAVITAWAPNGAKAQCTVKVKNAPASVKLNAKKIWMQYDAESGIGAEFVLTPKLTRGSASGIRWSYDSRVVSVTPGGLVTAVGVGTTTIFAKTYNGKKAKCKVTVYPYGVSVSPYRESHSLRVIAHRGGRAYWPENTVTAFANARSKGSDGVELDVYTSRDGVQVVHHDAYIASGKVKYYISNCTLEQLRRVKPDLCTLDEALETVAAQGLELWLEMKYNADPAACVQAVERWGLKDRTTYISFQQDRLAGVRQADPSARMCLLFSKVPRNLAAIAASLRLTGVSAAYTCVSQAWIDQWHAMGLEVSVWTVNAAIDIKTMRDMGADYICTDYPDRADALR